MQQANAKAKRNSNKSTKTTPGGVRKGVSSTFAAAAYLSDEEEERREVLPVVVTAEAKAVMAEDAWGDQDLTEGSDTQQDLRDEVELWREFGLSGLDEHNEGVFKTDEMSDGAYILFMQWLYRHGWDVTVEDRNFVYAEPGFFMCRTWTPQKPVERIAPAPSKRWEPEPVFHPVVKSVPKPEKQVEELSAPGTDIGRRNGCPVARFCKEGHGCQTAGCRYVHGDTIPRVNEPCKFGASCGSGDAAKRATCLRLHPGEVWTADLVITRVTA